MSGSGNLFLDLSKSVGWAFGKSLDACPAWGVWKLPEGFELGRIFAAYENALLDKLAELNPEKVGMEAPLAANQQTDAFTAELQIGLAAVTECACYRWEKPLTRRSSGTLRAQVCGRSRRTDEERHARRNVKDVIVAPWIASMGWAISDHNARDAAVGLAYELGYRAERPRVRHVERVVPKSEARCDDTNDPRFGYY